MSQRESSSTARPLAAASAVCAAVLLGAWAFAACDQGTVAVDDAGDLGTQFADNPSPPQDVPTVQDTAPADPGPTPDTAAPPDVPEDIPPDPGPVCTPPLNRPIMAPCDSDCQCATGFCYQEAFLGDFSFCSLDCSTAGDVCNSLTDGDGIQKYMCLNLAGSLASNYDLVVTHPCVLRCDDVDECKKYASVYDQCGNASAGKATSWDGHTIALDKACLIQSKIDP